VTERRSDTAAIRIAQITDTHLYADPDSRLLGLDTHHSLRAVIELARRRKPDLVIASGDLAHDASPAAYKRLAECFRIMAVPVYCLPGNHDEAAALRNCLPGAGCVCPGEVRLQGWQLIFLDSTLAGSEGGHLSATELQRLEQCLHAAPDLHALVALHHQPVAVGSRWLDSMAVDNATAFFSVIDRHPQVRAIIWGHVHQQFEQHHKEVKLLATPSTCIQFLPRSETFAVEPVPPGYRWIDLYSDGRIESGIERLATIPGSVDLSTRGY
jgi:Icc protein